LTYNKLTSQTSTPTYYKHQLAAEAGTGYRIRIRTLEFSGAASVTKQQKETIA